MNHKLAIGAALSVLLLAGCHSMRHEPWQDAQVAQPLQIPAGLDRPGTSAEMAVPANAASVEGAVHAVEVLPPTSITLDVESGVDATWQAIGGALDAAGAGTVLSRDADRHAYGVSYKGSELDLPRRGFFYRLTHRAPDMSRSYYAAIQVFEENGQVQVRIDGDGLAVNRVHGLLDGKLK